MALAETKICISCGRKFWGVYNASSWVLPVCGVCKKKEAESKRIRKKLKREGKQIRRKLRK